MNDLVSGVAANGGDLASSKGSQSFSHVVDDDDREYLWEKRSELLYQVQLSALYHQKRERFFDIFDKGAKAISIFGGSAALAKLSNPDALVWIAAVITVASTMSLVLGFSDKSKRHSELARAMRQIESEVVGKGEREFTEEEVAGWSARLRIVESTEPPALGALVIECQNELALGQNHPEMVVSLSFWQKLTKNFFDSTISAASLPVVKKNTSGEPANAT